MLYELKNVFKNQTEVRLFSKGIGVVIFDFNFEHGMSFS